jgi:pimeloyl-ACP methyl ester carboxylesterase
VAVDADQVPPLPRPLLAGRIPPGEMYPAGVPGIETHWLDIDGRLRLRVLQAGPQDGRPVLLIHGWGASVYSWRHAIPALANEGCRVHAVDMPGHGLSDKPAGREWYSREAMTHVAARVLELLDLSSALVAGHSMGGGITLSLALARHPRVARIALIAPVGLGPVRLTGVLRVAAPLPLASVAHLLVPRLLVQTLLTLAYFDASRLGERDIDEYWAPSQFEGFAAATVHLLREFSWDPAPPAALAELRCPVLVVEPTRDHLIPDVETGARAIPGARIARVPGGHAVLEENPGGTLPVLLAFARG